MRGGAIFGFLFLKTPNSWAAYTVSIFLVLGSLFENTTLDGLFNKNLPKDIRGTLNSIYNLFGGIGIIILAVLGGYLSDNVNEARIVGIAIRFFKVKPCLRVIPKYSLFFY